MFTLNIKASHGIIYFTNPVVEYPPADTPLDESFRLVDEIPDGEVNDEVCIKAVHESEDYAKLHLIFDESEMPNTEFFSTHSFLLNTPGKFFRIMDWDQITDGETEMYAEIPVNDDVTLITIQSLDEYYSELYCYFRGLHVEL